MPISLHFQTILTATDQASTRVRCNNPNATTEAGASELARDGEVGIVSLDATSVNGLEQAL